MNPQAGYTLTWNTDAPLPPSDVSMLRPDVIGHLERDALAATPVRVGRSSVRLDVLFTIDGSPGDTLTLRHLPPVARLGAHMAGGTLVIDGDAGDDLGAAMKAGLIRVRGSAGHRVGGPATTTDRGMTGGEVVIDRQAGDHVGLRMRRGLIIVGGPVGRSPGYRMLAGTIVLQQGAGLDHPGLEMRRGSVFITDRKADVTHGAHMRDAGDIGAAAMPAYALLVRHLRTLGLDLPDLHADDRLHLWTGDQFELDKGEIVQWRN